ASMASAAEACSRGMARSNQARCCRRRSAPPLLTALALSCAMACRKAPPPDVGASSAAPPSASKVPEPANAGVLHDRTPIELPEERHLRDVRMLTDGGENAEAYWSWDSRRLVFQARRGAERCDRILTMSARGKTERVVAADGAHTCA